MYEMKGALSGRAAPDRPVARLLRCHAPPDGAKHPPEPPVSRLFPCPEVALGWCPFPSVKAFLLPLWGATQESAGIHFCFFSVHTLSTECRQLSARRNGYPPAFTQFIHRLPSVTRGIRDMVAVCNCLVFPDRARAPAAVGSGIGGRGDIFVISGSIWVDSMNRTLERLDGLYAGPPGTATPDWCADGQPRVGGVRPRLWCADRPGRCPSS